MIVLQFNPVPMLLLALLILVVPTLILLISAFIAFKKEKKKNGIGVFIVSSIVCDCFINFSTDIECL